MLPFGPWHPDAASINSKVCLTATNVVPNVNGFAPVRSAVASTDALDSRCFGATVMLRYSNATAAFAGTATKLYKLGSSGLTWSDVSRTAGGAYATAVGEMWRFAPWGDTILAVNYNDVPQVFDIGGAATNFAALAGSPPKGRFIDVVRDQVVIAGVYGNENRIQWSGTNNSTQWTPGTNNSDYQDFQAGGPVRGFLGGATGWVFLADQVVRMTQTPGASTIYQFDVVQGAKGCAAQSSTVRVGDVAYYLATDGFYMMDLNSGAQKPIGHQKWRQWFLSDMRASTWLNVYGAADPVSPLVMWAYVSKSNGTTVPDKVVIYDRVLDEATIAVISIEAMATWITSGVSLDTMNSYGNMETLPYSLDSPYWRGGTSLIGLFGTDHKLAHLLGATLAATVDTADGMSGQRALVTGVTPYIDTANVSVALAMRERDADSVLYDEATAPEDTGSCPMWNSGNIARARVATTAGSSWTLLKGLDTTLKARGKR